MNAWNVQSSSELSRIEQQATQLGRLFIVTFANEGASPIRQQPTHQTIEDAYQYGLRIAQQWPGVKSYRIEVGPQSGYGVGLPRSPGL